MSFTVTYGEPEIAAFMADFEARFALGTLSPAELRALVRISDAPLVQIKPAEPLVQIKPADGAAEDTHAAADAQILSQDVTGAFDRLIGLVKRTAGDERIRVRTRLIELFELFDPADPDVIAGRRNLANALY